MKKNNLLLSFYFLLFVFFCVYSFAFVDPNLTLTSWRPFLSFQEKIIKIGYFQKPLSTIIFIIISFLLLITYYSLLITFKKDRALFKRLLYLAIFISGILIFSYPAFSHDVFNYIFNAKMVLHYHVDPHKQVALDFAHDPWTRFMRNTHTPAPYYYGWTLISLLPAILGMDKFVLNLFLFKVFSLVIFWLCCLLLNKITQFLNLEDKDWRLIIFLLNPLILIETIGIGHNDLTMMSAVLVSFLFLIKFKKTKKLKYLFFSLLAIGFSISIKYATVILVPLFIIWFLKERFDIGFWGAILLFLLPFLRPLDQLHSWYLAWPLVWILLSKNKFFIKFSYFLSAFALFRYAPFIYYGHWNQPVLTQRLIIYFTIPTTFLIYRLLRTLYLKKLCHPER